jgi:hypothetical protein
LEGELLEVLLALPLGYLLPTLDIGHHNRQATANLLSHLLSMARLRKLSLEEGNLPDKGFHIFASRG